MLGGIGLFAVLVATAVTAAAPAATSTATAGHQCIVATGSGDTTFTRDFNPYDAGGRRVFTLGAIYEPLVVITPAGGGHTYMWLASKLKWINGGKTLVITVRHGVTWSDGTPLTNKDVLFSLVAGLKNPLMDKIGLTNKDTDIKSIRSVGKDKVTITLTQVDSTFVGSQLNNQFVVPAHIFAAHVGDIDKWTNPNPVGSGPFTQITRFNGQDYVLGKNPHYWQPGVPHIPCVERIAAASNDAALVQIISGQADWTTNFVPNVEKAYIAKDPAHYHAYYATTSLPIGLFFDDTKYPNNIVAFRKALSMAVDRSKVSKLGEYGYAPPADPVGIGQMWPTWVDKSLAPQVKKLATYDPAAAKSTLTAAGFTYQGGKLLDPHGNPINMDIHVIGGWSDWAASLNIVAQNLQDIGINAQAKLEPDWDSWYPNAAATKFATFLWNGGGGPTPYGYFKAHLDPSSNVGSGNDASATANWEHFDVPAAAPLLQQFRGTLDVKKQHVLANQLQSIFLQNLPYVPLFIGPLWSTYSTKYFAGYPTPKNPYVLPQYTALPDNVVILTRLRPT
ncbi:MAG: ABC transporter substrate-binding protein [Gaiellaceae bacterium]